MDTDCYQVLKSFYTMLNFVLFEKLRQKMDQANVHRGIYDPSYGLRDSLLHKLHCYLLPCLQSHPIWYHGRFETQECFRLPVCLFFNVTKLCPEPVNDPKHLFLSPNQYSNLIMLQWKIHFQHRCLTTVYSWLLLRGLTLFEVLWFSLHWNAEIHDWQLQWDLNWQPKRLSRSQLLLLQESSILMDATVFLLWHWIWCKCSLSV